ncbi:MAG: response regulator transcription factor [Flavobacterium sp.]|nr:response regulator transcription factor [Flavobacterium sp.]
MIKTILIEDDEILRKGLHQMLELYAPNFVVIAEAETVANAVEVLLEKEPDVVFLDIMLIGGTGFDVLKQYQVKNGFPNFQLVFITAFEEYAIKAFRMSALDYLLKPVDPDELKEVIRKIEKAKTLHPDSFELLIDQLGKQNHNKKIALATAEGIHIVLIDEIVYAQADNNYTTIVLNNNKQIIVSKPLKEYEELLAEKGFLRIHQSYLINTQYVQFFDKMEHTVQLNTNAILPVASRKKELLLQTITKLTR